MERPVNYGFLVSHFVVGSSAGGKSRRLSRRLITLIFVGRNRIIVIRRELPRTNDADSARRPTALIRIKLQFVGCESISYSAKQLLLIRDSHPVAVKLGKRDAELLMVALGFFLEDANRHGLPQGHRIISVGAPVDPGKNTVTEAHVAR